MNVSAYYNAPSGMSTSGDYFSNTQFTKMSDANRWRATDAKYWPQNGTLDLFAYSADGLSCGNTSYTPTYHLANVARGVTLSVADNYSTQCDILFGRVAAATRDASGNAMQMRHAEACIIVAASSTVAYNSTTNVGVTLDAVTVNSVKCSGTLAIDATQAAGSQCTWSSLGSSHDLSIKTTGGSTALAYNVPTTPMDITAAGNHMGIGGVGLVVPEQAQTSLTIVYTIHNGKNASGGNLNNTVAYSYTCTPGSTWDEGKKYVYYIGFTMNEIIINPTVTDWVDGGTVNDPDPANGHAYVDLGLRVGGNKILFATMNIGASSVSEFGDYFAWGETSKKYTGVNNNGNYNTGIVGGSFTKENSPYYIGNDNWSKYNTTDNKTTLDPSDDGATVMWGGNWRMPDISELEYLSSSNCTKTAYNYSSSPYGIGGYLITGKGNYSNNSIFLPAAGKVNNTSVSDSGFCNYWSRTRRSDYVLWTASSQVYQTYHNDRQLGMLVRPVLVIPE